MNTGTTETKKRIAKRIKVKEDVLNPRPAEAPPKVGKVDSKKKKEKKPQTPAEWLQSYIKEGELTTSGAKLCTYLLTNKEGANIQYLIQRCSEIASMKQSNWGKTSSSIKSHLRFLKQKGLEVQELKKDVFKVSA